MLPKTYNDGSEVEPQHFKTTWDELDERFNRITANEGRGGWRHLGQVYEEQNYVYKVDVPGKSELKYISGEYKEILKARFNQHEIYMIVYPIRRL